MRRLVTLLGALVIVALAGLWFGPRAMDWEPWRERLAEIATARLGRTVTLKAPPERITLNFNFEEFTARMTK